MNKLTIKILILTILISCNQKKNKVSIDLKTNLKTEETTKVNLLKIKKEDDIISPEIKMLEYLSLHFNRVQDSTFLKKPDFMIGSDKKDTICGYVIPFKEGHSFKHEQECVEWGEIVTVKFNNFSANQVREIVESLFKKDNYDWYENNTEYRPYEYYERLWTFRIIENEKSTDLEFAYSWI